MNRSRIDEAEVSPEGTGERMRRRRFPGPDLVTGGMIVATTTLAYAFALAVAVVGNQGQPVGIRFVAVLAAVAVVFEGAGLWLVARIQSPGSAAIKVTSGTLLSLLAVAAVWLLSFARGSLPWWIMEACWIVELLLLLASGILVASRVFARDEGLGCAAIAWRLALGAGAVLLAVDGLLLGATGSEVANVAFFLEPSIIAGVLVAVSWTLLTRPRGDSP